MPQVNVAFLSCVNPLIGAGYWIPEIISCAGGLSLCGSAGCPSKSLTLADLMQRDPDVVVYLSHRLHAASLATELSWLATNKEWRNLKAVKANRFFLIDANRFFIDSASNVITSAELMTEILHGFGHGHEGKGFVRWQNRAIFKDMPDSNISLPQTVNEVKAPTSSVNHIDVDMHEVQNSAIHDHPKYVTNVSKVRKPESDIYVINAGADIWDRDLVVVESNQEQRRPSTADSQKCLQSKIIRQISTDTLPHGDKVISNYGDGNAIDFHKTWCKPAIETALSERNQKPSAQRTSFVQDQKEKNGDQELISKVWASTQSAAQMRNKGKVFQKSTSLPVSRGSLGSKASTVSIIANTAHVMSDSPRKASSFSVYRSISKPSTESTSCLRLAKNSSHASGGDRAIAACIPSHGKFEKSCSLEIVPTRRSTYSVPSSPRVDVKLGKARMIRDAVLKSLVDLPYSDCLFLSGGLASSILAEAVPLVHSKGFRLGFTVLAGPAATDRVSAAVAAKCKGMEHVTIGEGEKGFAVFLLAKELTFVVETLKTFDPVQIRNLVPIAAALREARSRGLEHVVTGDGLDELLSRDGIPLDDVQTLHFAILRVLSKAVVLLGEALGIKVVQPFLHPKLIKDCKSLTRNHAEPNCTAEYGRAILREAFPEVSAACRQKSFNEVDSGMFYVSDYFSSAISASVLESKAKHIYQKERVRIRDAEHLVYYRSFKRVFKGKAPKGMVRWASKPCAGCGYELLSEMSWYCLVCGLSQRSHNVQSKQKRPDQAKIGHRKVSSNLQGSTESVQHSSNGKASGRSNGSKHEGAVELDSVLSLGSERRDGKHGSKKLAQEVKREKIVSQHKPEISKPVGTNIKCMRLRKQKSVRRKQPNYWAILGAGSAGLLLLLQLVRR